MANDITEFGKQIVNKMAQLIDMDDPDVGGVTSEELADEFEVEYRDVVRGLTKLVDSGYVKYDNNHSAYPTTYHLTIKGWKFAGYFDG